jgi:hypothetical protein
VTAAGRYCFRAEFSGDTSVGVPGSSDSSAGECFTVAPVQPALTTDATDGPVDFGQPISDTVTLSGTAHKPGTGGPAGSNGSINPTTFGGDATGNITVTAFGPDSCSTVAFTSGPIAASGDGTYGGAGTAFQFIPDAPGQYIFVASYAGDLPNTLNIPASACSAAPDAEKVTVRQVTPILSTKQFVYPQDKAKITCSPASDCSISGAGNLSGTVAFKLYDTLANCQANGETGLLFGPQSFAISGAAPQTATTNNTSAAVTAGTTVYWRVTYTSSIQAHSDAAPSACTEQTTVSFVGDDATITVP